MAAMLFKHNGSEEHRMRYKLIMIDQLAKSPVSSQNVIPAKAGIK